ncbi:hypothetical protein [Chamaesiphon sp.]|uniref:hypothetical protein n=1 Tax=Chamaesiphon sp. TaxID=2814140 RepID=UPI003593D0B9
MNVLGTSMSSTAGTLCDRIGSSIKLIGFICHLALPSQEISTDRFSHTKHESAVVRFGRSHVEVVLS